MITETTYALHALHTIALHLTPDTAHTVTTTHTVMSTGVAAPGGPPNIFDQLFGIGDDFKTAVFKRGIGVILAIAVIGAALMVAGVQIGRTIMMRTVLGLFAVFFILGPLLTYLTDKFGAITG